ncbi:NAD(P)H-dependent oxidoreductase [Leucobacter sp. OH2974_COT-288]|nr:NAD(P)H-dependent oxidoreductase [Leucobacter sp. OH2974_COT-288]
MKKIGVIVGSVRPNNVCSEISKWALNEFSTAVDTDSVKFETVDLGEINLPLYNEPFSPAQGKPRVHDHTVAWATLINDYDGLVFLLPEYNGSYTAAVKNAIDYLSAEWKEKPVSYIAYSWSSGQSVAAEFTKLAKRMGMNLLPAFANLKLSPENFNADGSAATVTADSYAAEKQDVQDIAKAFAAL